MKRLVAFSGIAAAGKTTAARFLEMRGFQRLRFAGPLKDMLRALGLSEAHIDGNLKELPCALLGGKSPRFAMQTLGTEWGRNLIDPDLWMKIWRHRTEEALAMPGGAVVVDDLRFPNEEAIIREMGGYIIQIHRHGAGTESKHESEQHVIQPDYNIMNNGSLLDFEKRLIGALQLCDDEGCEHHGTDHVCVCRTA